MKKFMNWMLAILLICGASVLASCSSNDDNSGKEPEKVKFTKAVVKYTVTANAATLGLFKVNVYGTDADGNGFVETMSNQSYTKTVEIPVSKLPCTVELYMRASPLEGKSVTEKFDFMVVRSIDVMTLNSDDTVVAAFAHSNTSAELNIPIGDSLAELAYRMNSHLKFIVDIDANGEITYHSK